MEHNTQQEAIAIFYSLSSIIAVSSCHRVNLLTRSWRGRRLLAARAVEIGRLIVKLPCRSWCDRQAALGQQIDRPIDRNANLAGSPVGPAIAVQGGLLGRL